MNTGNCAHAANTGRRDGCSLKSARPAQLAASAPDPLCHIGASPLSQYPPILQRPQACTHQSISSSAPSTLEHLAHRTTRPKWHPSPSPPPTVTGCPRDHLPVPREVLTHIVILEGMEKVASQLPVVSWSARGIANATYVVWRILWEMEGRQSAGPCARPEVAGCSPACPTHIPQVWPHPPGSHSTKQRRCPHTQSAAHLLLEVHLCLPTLHRGTQRRRALLSMQQQPPRSSAPNPPDLLSSQQLCFEHWLELAAAPVVEAGRGKLCQHAQALT